MFVDSNIAWVVKIGKMQVVWPNLLIVLLLTRGLESVSRYVCFLEEIDVAISFSLHHIHNE